MKNEPKGSKEERTPQGRAPKILRMAGRIPRSKTLRDSGWIEMSATMDSGAAVTTPHIGRECCRSSHIYQTGGTAKHHGSAFRERLCFLPSVLVP